MAEQGGSLAIGAVLGRAFGVMKGNPATVFGIAFLVGALPQAVFGYYVRSLVTIGDPDAQAGLVGVYLGFGFVFLICSALTQSALVRASGAYLEGRSASIGECLATGLAKVLPVIALSILMWLGLMVGFMLLVVPAVILGLMWSVAIPALVEDDAGVIEAFGRSRYLTKGSRWAILALLIVAMVITWLVALVAFIPGALLGAAGLSGAMVMGVSLISSTFNAALWSTVLTSLYFALRDRREGPRTEQLASVFA